MACDDLIGAIAVLAKLAPSEGADRVLRRTIADLGGLIGDRGLAPARPVGDGEERGAAKQGPAERSTAKQGPAKQSAKWGAAKRGVDIPPEILAWLHQASPTELGQALTVKRVRVYDWRRSGRCAPEILERLTALYEENRATQGRPTPAPPAARADDELELEIRARCAADGVTRAELLELAEVEDLATEDRRAKMRELLLAI